MENKTYQKLRKANLNAAENIYNVLKEHKVLSAQEFRHTFFRSRKDLPSDGYYKNWETTENFLIQHGLMTSKCVNGFRFYFATQKCVRTHSFENATREYQYTTYDKIGEAIKYQKINDGMVEPEVEGRVIGKLLGFTGEVLNKYTKAYVIEYLFRTRYDDDKEYIRYSITAPTHQIPEIKVLK